MVRVKKGVHAAKTRRNVLKMAKGFKGLLAERIYQKVIMQL